MASGVQRLDLVNIDLDRGGMIRSRLGRILGQDDADENQFGVRVFRNGRPESVSGATVRGYFTDADGERTIISSGTGASDNIAYVTLPASCYQVAGEFRLAIKLTQGGVTSTLRIVDGTISDTNYIE